MGEFIVKLEHSFDFQDVLNNFNMGEFIVKLEHLTKLKTIL